MTSATLLTVIAIVATAGTDSTRIDKGFADGLRVGDRGKAYYELNVGGTKRRVDAGGAEVISVDAQAAVVATLADKSLREGFFVEFEVPGERVSPAAVLAFARDAAAKEGSTLDAAALQRLMPSDPETQEALLAWLENQRLQRLAEAAVRTAREAVRAAVIPAGAYEIGLSAGEARYYNQQPPFEFNTGALAIDTRPVTTAEFRLFRPRHDPVAKENEVASSVSFDDAAAYCRWRGARLPTEFEWEVAIRQRQVSAPPGQLEWTASWYAPYPGNTRPEAQYGERYRVLRGGLGGADGMLDPHRRRFMEPSSTSAEVGFRCARSVAG